MFADGGEGGREEDKKTREQGRVQVGGRTRRRGEQCEGAKRSESAEIHVIRRQGKDPEFRTRQEREELEAETELGGAGRKSATYEREGQRQIKEAEQQFEGGFEGEECEELAGDKLKVKITRTTSSVNQGEHVTDCTG